MAAVVPAVEALVHVDAVLLVVRQQNVSGWTLAVVSTLGVHADVRATQVHVVLKLFALVDVFAGSLILFQSEAQGTGAANLLAVFFTRVAMMRAVPVVLLATVDQSAGFTVVVQSISRRTRATKRPD